MEDQHFAGLLTWLGCVFFASTPSAEQLQIAWRKRFPQLATDFLSAAQATGKPRGLRWLSCELGETPLFARRTTPSEILGLVSVVVHFAAEPDSDMVDVPAVNLPRAGTAVFVWQKDRWLATGRVVFNLSPSQVLMHFGATHRPYPTSPSSA